MIPPNGAAAPDALRDLVREVLRDVLPTLAAPPPTGLAGVAAPAGAGETAAGSGVTVRPVRLATNEELHEFVLQVLRLADNPKRRRDLLAGRLRFALAPSGGGPVATGGGPRAGSGPPVAAPSEPGGGHPVRVGGRAGAPPSGSAGVRVERGAVTERMVQAAAGTGTRLVLGPRAVLTPLARDRARALGVPIEKER